jgi:transposase
MDLRMLVSITCACCGKTCQGYAMQYKELAKKLGWKHGKGKGVWVCPECQKFISAQPE